MICSRRLFLVSCPLLLFGAPFLILAAHEPIEIIAEGELNYVALNSSNPSIDENNTGAMNNNSQVEEKMQIQICDESHPC